MKGYIFELYSQLENQLKTIELEEDDCLKSSEASFKLCIESIEKLKTHVMEHDFQNEEAEIHFFKKVKPRFYSKLIYYNEIFNIETSKPAGSIKAKKIFLNKELEKLKYFFDANIDLYQYYRSGNTVLDQSYFLRGKYDIRLKLDSRFNDSDHKFSTSHDHKISKILAFELLQIHLENQLATLKHDLIGKNQDNNPASPFIWTGNKVSLIELMYALFASGNFNNGKIDIKTIAVHFEKIFKIELGDYYRAYTDIKGRNHQTKFIDTLREELIRKMENDDER